MPIFPSDTSACGFLILPPFSGVIGPNIRYSTSTAPISTSNLYPGDTIFFDQQLFIHDTIGQCTILDSMLVNISVPPFIGIDSSLTICQGYSENVFNLMSILGNPIEGGAWVYPSVPDFAPSDSTMVDFSVLPIGEWTLTYGFEDVDCGLQTSNVTITVIEPPFGGDNAIIDTCAGGQSFDFMALVGNPDLGGMWEQVDGPDIVDLTDSTNVNLSNLTPGNYAFLYIIEGEATTGFCEGESSSLLITLSSGANAGEDNMTTVCLGETVDFSTFISFDADMDGMLDGDGILSQDLHGIQLEQYLINLMK